MRNYALKTNTKRMFAQTLIVVVFEAEGKVHAVQAQNKENY